MVRPNIPTAPLIAVDKPLNAFHFGVIEPIIAVAPNISLVAPIVIAFAVGSEMDITTSRIAGSDLVVEGESFPSVHSLQRDFVIPTPVNFRHDAFNPMPEVFKHLANPSFVIEAHDDEVAFEPLVNERHGVAPVSGRSDHVRFPIAEVWSAEEPNFVYFTAVNPFNQFELVNDFAVVNTVGFVPSLPFTPATQVCFVVVNETVNFDGNASKSRHSTIW